MKSFSPVALALLAAAGVATAADMSTSECAVCSCLRSFPAAPSCCQSGYADRDGLLANVHLQHERQGFRAWLPNQRHGLPVQVQ